MQGIRGAELQRRPIRVSMEQSSEPLLQQAFEGASTAEIRAQDRKGGLGASASEASQTDDLRQERGGDGAVAVDVAVSPKARRLSSYKRTLGNMIVSIVGAGVLGLPYAFRRSGWAFSILALAAMAVVSFYGMLLLVKTRKILEAEARGQSSGPAPEAKDGEGSRVSDPLQAGGIVEHLPGESASASAEFATEDPSVRALMHGRKHEAKEAEEDGEGYFLRITSYGELGNRVMGTLGQVSVDAMVCISQSGFCVAYLIFIAENVSHVLSGSTAEKLPVIAVAVVVQIFLSWIRSLSRLAPFSIFADVVNVCAFSVIIFYGFLNLSRFPALHAFTGIHNAPAALGVAVYSFEGVGMTLALESSMKKPLQFPSVLSLGITAIAATYSSVGLMGYVAFGEDTRQIVTLNLPAGWASSVVKLGLSVALCFTFPLMMHPVYAVYETRLCQHPSIRNHVLPNTLLRRIMFRSLRAIVICFVGLVAACVPHFATFISLIGSSVCSLLGFVFPAMFHLRVGSATMPLWEKVVDYFLIVFGLAFGVWGTYDALIHFEQR